MTRTPPPPPPRAKRFIDAESYRGHRRASPLSPGVAAATNRGFGPAGRPRQTARKASPAPRRHATGRGGGPFAFDDAEEDNDDNTDGDRDDDEDGHDGGEHPATVVDLTTPSSTGSREDDPVDISSDESSSFQDDEDPTDGPGGQSVGDDTAREEESDYRYDATPKPRSSDGELYPEVNTPIFSREAHDQLSSELQQSIERELNTTGIIGDIPQYGIGHDREDDGWGSLHRTPAEIPRRQRSAGPPSRSIPRTFGGGSFGSDGPPILPPLGTLLRQSDGQRLCQRGPGESVDGADNAPSRSARNGWWGPENGRQRSPDCRQRQNTADLSSYKSSASPEPEHPALKKLENCERERSELNDAIRTLQQEIADLYADNSRLGGEVVELQRQNDDLRRANDAGSTEYVQRVNPEDVFFHEPDDESVIDDDVEDALQRCEQLKASLRRRKDEWKGLAQRAVQALWRLSDQYADQTTRLKSLNDEEVNLEEGHANLQAELDEVREDRDLQSATLDDVRTDAVGLQQQHERLQQENQQAQDRNEELEQVLRGLQDRVANRGNPPETPQGRPQGNGWSLEEECDEKRWGDREVFADLGARILELETRFVEAETQVNSSEVERENNVAEMQAEINDLNRQLADAINDFEQQSQLRETVERDVSTLRAQLQNVQAEDQVLRSQATRLSHRLRNEEIGAPAGSQAQSDSDDLQKQLQELHERYDGIKKRLDNCEKRGKGADTERGDEELRQELIDKQKEMQSIIDDLSARLSNANDRLDSVGSTSPSRKRKRGSSARQSEDDMGAELQARIESLDEANTKLGAEVDRLQKDLDECRKHRQELEHRQLASVEEEVDDEEEGGDPRHGPLASGRGSRGGRRGRGSRGGRGGRGAGGGRVKKALSKPATKNASKPAADVVQESIHIMTLRERKPRTG
ncbi:hypothetical protein DOTSEDRAFT_20048 [Dothistroma septosporum NZE10]|uniref:Uncharacterized protein n=1 Tax=Dothistroma septosporum (strain NZE10 / CBS 128990) TaxID=675120 RepID=N1Q4P8_DOTSN|nr:hypothetical protein DOTSEDRAFT_20048 [Dothistroma septosporum NZE10]